jgi:hypothetical protein
MSGLQTGRLIPAIPSQCLPAGEVQVMGHLFKSVNVKHCSLYLTILFAAFSFFPLHLGAIYQLSSASVTATPEADPDKEASELNHHIAGGFLIAIGLSVIYGNRGGSLPWLRWLPPVLFVATGLFLAAWSDDEMWPRGNLNWLWLLRHDAEALQHKLYALLLIILGIVEFMQTSTRFRKPWLALAFPVLCVMGGASLFAHHHSSMAAAPMDAIHPLVRTSANFQSSNECPIASAGAPAHHHGATSPPGHCLSASGPVEANTSPDTQEHMHEHMLTGSTANIQREHAWFAIVGLFVALFKVLHDVVRPAGRVPESLWAGSVILLGVLLLLYTE